MLGAVTVSDTGTVTAVQVLTGGTGYSSATPPVVSVSGPGSGCVVACTVVGGIVTGITVTSPGSLYNCAPDIVEISGGGGIGFSISGITITNGQITGMTVGNPGINYVTPPILTIVDGGGTGATAVTYLTPSGSVANVTMVSMGSGYNEVSSIGDVATTGGGSGLTFNNIWYLGHQ